MARNKKETEEIKEVVIHDWKKVKKLYDSLGIPDIYFNPWHCPLGDVKYNVLMSERKTGKTTNVLLMGMCLNAVDGTILQYVRVKDEMLYNKNIYDLFETILSCDYVSKVTKGKYNSVMYKAHRWYYCNKDDGGNILDIAGICFMVGTSVDKHEIYKSAYNAPTGDFVIYDEFIRTYYQDGEFEDFMDLLDTIIRFRNTAFIFMLANTIDTESQYFLEMEIYDLLQTMEIGDKVTTCTDDGTNIYVELISNDYKKIVSENKALHNRLYFGFKNKRLQAITGKGWAIKEYPHINGKWENVVISRNRYIEINGKLIQLELVSNELGYCVLAHFGNHAYDDSVVYVSHEVMDIKERYGYGYSKLDRVFWKLYNMKKWYYSNNTVGNLVKKFTEKINFD